MKKILSLALFAFLPMFMSAKDNVPPKAGDIISGRVIDTRGYPIGVGTLTEQDQDGNIYTTATTGALGEFSFTLAGENHTLNITYGGYSGLKSVIATPEMTLVLTPTGEPDPTSQLVVIIDYKSNIIGAACPYIDDGKLQKKVNSISKLEKFVRKVQEKTAIMDCQVQISNHASFAKVKELVDYLKTIEGVKTVHYKGFSEIDGSEEYPEEDFSPKAGDIITGTVDSEDGPVAMATITELDERLQPVAQTKSDANGKFSFTLSGRGHQLKVEKEGYRKTTQNIYDRQEYVWLTKEGNEYACMIKMDTTISIRFASDQDYIGLKNTDELENIISDKIIRGAFIAVRNDPDNLLPAIKDILKKNNSEVDLIDNKSDGDIVLGKVPMRLTTGNRPVMTGMAFEDDNVHNYPLIVVDELTPVIPLKKLQEFDFKNDSNDKEKIAQLIGVKADQIESISVSFNESTSPVRWGPYTKNGLIEITTKSKKLPLR